MTLLEKFLKENSLKLIANASGCESHSTVYGWREDIGRVRLKTIRNIATFLGVKPSELIADISANGKKSKK